MNTKNTTTAQKDIEHLALVALVYATRLQLQKYLHLTKVQQHDKLTYQNAGNALKNIERRLTGSLINLTNEEKELLKDSSSCAGVCVRIFARVAALIGNINNEQLFDLTEEIEAEFAKGIPEEYRPLLKEH
jgi:hypothetical protein